MRDGDELDNDVDVEVAEAQLISRGPPSPHAKPSVHRNRPALFCRLYAFVLLAPALSLLLVNLYYFHRLSLSTGSAAEYTLDFIHAALHTDAVRGEGGIDASLLSLVPANASALHAAGCGATGQQYDRGVCYSVAQRVDGALRYADCAALIPVDALHGGDIHDAPPAEVNLYGPLCRPLPQGRPDRRTFDPYTVRCDLPNWVLPRNAARAPALQPAPTPPPPPSTSHFPPLPTAEQIPRVIYQTQARATFLTPMAFRAMRSWMDRNPDHRYAFYDDDDAARFVADFSHPLLTAAQCDDVREAAAAVRLHMPMAAYADLLRYMLLLAYGGVYVDSDTACVDALSSWLDYAHDSFVVQSNMDLQWIIIAAPSHPVSLDTLLSAVHNVLHPLRAELVVSPVYETTGPTVQLGAIARYRARCEADPTLRPIRVVPSDPPPAQRAALDLTLHGRAFNSYQFANHLMLKACEVEWEQRLHEAVPWVYKQKRVMAQWFYPKLARWQRLSVLACASAALLWWAAHRKQWVRQSAFTACTALLVGGQIMLMVHNRPI